MKKNLAIVIMITCVVMAFCCIASVTCLYYSYTCNNGKEPSENAVEVDTEEEIIPGPATGVTEIAPFEETEQLEETESEIVADYFTEENGFSLPTKIIDFKGTQLEIGFVNNPDLATMHYAGVESHDELKDSASGLYVNDSVIGVSYSSNGQTEISENIPELYTNAEKDCLLHILSETGQDAYKIYYGMPSPAGDDGYPHISMKVILPNKKVWSIISTYDTAYCFDYGSDYDGFMQTAMIELDGAQEYVDMWFNDVPPTVNP